MMETLLAVAAHQSDGRVGTEPLPLLSTHLRSVPAILPTACAGAARLSFPLHLLSALFLASPDPWCCLPSPCNLFPSFSPFPLLRSSSSAMPLPRASLSHFSPRAPGSFLCADGPRPLHAVPCGGLLLLSSASSLWNPGCWYHVK